MNPLSTIGVQVMEAIMVVIREFDATLCFVESDSSHKTALSLELDSHATRYTIVFWLTHSHHRRTAGERNSGLAAGSGHHRSHGSSMPHRWIHGAHGLIVIGFIIIIVAWAWFNTSNGRIKQIIAYFPSGDERLEQLPKQHGHNKAAGQETEESKINESYPSNIRGRTGVGGTSSPYID